MTTTATKKCVETNQEGDPCKMPPLRGEDYCFAHSPTAARQRAEARERGGRNQRQEPKVATLKIPALEADMPADVADLLPSRAEVAYMLYLTQQAAFHGKLAESRAKTVATVTRALSEALDAVDKDERVRRVERMLERAEANAGR